MWTYPVLLQSSYDIVFSLLALALGSSATWMVGKFFNILENLEVPETVWHLWSE